MLLTKRDALTVLGFQSIASAVVVWKRLVPAALYVETESPGERCQTATQVRSDPSCYLMFSSSETPSAEEPDSVPSEQRSGQ